MSTMFADIPIHAWQGCYDDSWRGLITDEAFAHPAKFAPGLIRRIFAHGLDRGWWSKGDLVADPFGGIGGGGIMAGYAGLNWIGVELEERFFKLGNANLAMHGAKWLALGEANRVKLIQGDSRRFAELVGQAAGVVTSPPYAETEVASACKSQNPDGRQATYKRKHGCNGYAEETPGQIGALKSGDLAAVVTSPPYAETAVEKNSTGINIEKNWRTYKASGGGSSLEAYAATQAKHSGDYGNSPGQIGALKSGSVGAVVTSPPYAKCVKGEHGETETASASTAARRTRGGSLGQSCRHGGYGVSGGQIGALKEGNVAGVVTSPPWEKSLNDGYDKAQPADRYASWAKNLDGSNRLARSVGQDYGASDGQIGNERGETYWQAMDAVYRQCLIAIRPGGVLCVIVKDYVKDKARVPLCDQTLQLLMHIGFEPIERIHAMLVRETRHNNLFGGETVKRKERKSFFRRLAESKGSPRIDHEEVLVVRKPREGGQP